MVGEFAEAPFIGFDYFAGSGADDILESPNRFFLCGFAQVGPQDKDRFVAPQCARPPFGFKPPPAGTRKWKHGTNATMTEQASQGVRIKASPAATDGLRHAPGQQFDRIVYVIYEEFRGSGSCLEHGDGIVRNMIVRMANSQEAG
jgi:hypothetical protein